MTAPSGILPCQTIDELISAGAVAAGAPFAEGQVQPASLDLRLGRRAWRVRASFLPGGRPVAPCIDAVATHEIDLSKGEVLERGCVYIAEVEERLDLPADICARANPKSSTGRIDVFVRLLTDGSDAFDDIAPGYRGKLYVEIAPQTFSILVRPGDRLNQIRFRRGEARPTALTSVSVDLTGARVGYRARRHAGVIDLGRIGGHDPRDFWEPLEARRGQLVLDPGEFYILASKEAVEIPFGQAAEMTPIDPSVGEFRVHYAGFFDPGFGMAEAGGAGSRAVLEVRCRETPFLLEDGQTVARLAFEEMGLRPTRAYGEGGSHYQSQGLRLSKHFSDWS